MFKKDKRLKSHLLEGEWPLRFVRLSSISAAFVNGNRLTVILNSGKEFSQFYSSGDVAEEALRELFKLINEE